MYGANYGDRRVDGDDADEPAAVNQMAARDVEGGREGGADLGGAELEVAPPPVEVDESGHGGARVDGAPEASRPSVGLVTPDRRGGPDKAAVAQVRRSVPLPLVRKLRMHMDSCPSTNKSQFFYGGIGLMLASGLLDCAMVVYMVVGHTKFGPDLVARQIAGRYNVEDAFNHRQLVNIIRPYATAGAYDDALLQTWKRGTQALFMPIFHIMSYRWFFLLADDGNVYLGDPVVCPDDFEPNVDSGGLFLDADLMRECNRAAERQLRATVFPHLCGKRYRGVGERTVPQLSDAPPDSMLLPVSVSTCRKVRIFTRRCVQDK